MLRVPPNKVGASDPELLVLGLQGASEKAQDRRGNLKPPSDPTPSRLAKPSREADEVRAEGGMIVLKDARDKRDVAPFGGHMHWRHSLAFMEPFRKSCKRSG